MFLVQHYLLSEEAVLDEELVREWVCALLLLVLLYVLDLLHGLQHVLFGLFCLLVEFLHRLRLLFNGPHFEHLLLLNVPLDCLNKSISLPLSAQSYS